MKERWRETPFSEAVMIAPPVSLNKGCSYSFVEMNDLTPGDRYVKPSRLRQLTGGSRFAQRDTLFARITPCLENGKIAQVVGLKDGVGFGSTEFIVMRGRPGVSDTDFVHYLSVSETVRHHAEKSMSGTSGRQRVDVRAFDNLIVHLPPLPIQRRIAEVLGALDDKIECNLRVNQTLEAMAQALYEHWFVDSSESETRSLTDFIEIDPTIRITKGKEVPFVEMKALPNWSMSVTEVARRPFTSGSKFQNGDTLFVRITPCLENGKTAFVDFVEKDEAGFGSTEFIVLRAKRGISPQFVYCCARDENLRAHAIQSMVGSSGRQRVRSDCFSQFGVKRFSEQTMRAFQERISVWFDQIRANIRENQTLAHTRAYLLPKLLTGEVEVNAVEDISKGAL